MDYMTALRLATDLHDGQVDLLGDPMIRHVTRVSEASIRGPLAPPVELWADALVVGLLHEVIEDNLIDADGLREVGASEGQVTSITLLSRIPPYDDYNGYIRSIVESGDVVAAAVKDADAHDHLLHMARLRRIDPSKVSLEKRYKRVRRDLRHTQEERCKTLTSSGG